MYIYETLSIHTRLYVYILVCIHNRPSTIIASCYYNVMDLCMHTPYSRVLMFGDFSQTLYHELLDYLVTKDTGEVCFFFVCQFFLVCAWRVICFFVCVGKQTRGCCKKCMELKKHMTHKVRIADIVWLFVSHVILSTE